MTATAEDATHPTEAVGSGPVARDPVGRSSTAELTLIVSRRAHLNALRHLAEDLRAEEPGLRLFCFCPDDLIDDVVRAVGSEVAVSRLPRGPLLDLRRRLHTLLFNLLADRDFSPFFRRRVDSTVQSGKATSHILRMGRRLTPKLDGPRLNRLLTNVLSAFSWRRTFPTSRVVALTMPIAPHLLCTRRHDIVSVLDGWDHPTKVPIGYRTRVVASWNTDLGDDWRRRQGCDEVIGAYPYRFAYLLEHRSNHAPFRPLPGVRVRVLYAMATFPSRSTLHQRRHEEEIEAVKQLHAWIRTQVESFEVKPHPIGETGHLDRLAATCSGLIVHAYEESGAATYDLDDDYNLDRIRTLEAADVVVGIWTTFLLDAAVAGKAVAVLDLPADSPLTALSTAQHGPHVHHLRRRVSAVIHLGAQGPRFASGAGIDDWLTEAVASGERVAVWVVPPAEPRLLARQLLAMADR